MTEGTPEAQPKGRTGGGRLNSSPDETTAGGKKSSSPVETLVAPLNGLFERLGDSAARNPLLAGLLLLATVPTFLVIIAATVMRKMPPTTFLVGTYGSAAVIAAVVAYVFAQSQRRNPRRQTFGNTVGLAQSLRPTEKDDIKNQLQSAVNTTSDLFRIPPDKIRASLFGIDRRRRLRMIPDLRIGDYADNEHTVIMRPGEGVVGHCFDSGSPLMVVLKTQAGYMLKQSEQRKLHKNLAWVLAVPVKRDEEVIWVISVSGLQDLGGGVEFARVLDDLQRRSRDFARAVEASR